MHELDVTDQIPFPETGTGAGLPAQETVDIPETAISEDALVEDPIAEAAEEVPAITAPEGGDAGHEAGGTPETIGHSALSDTTGKHRDDRPHGERLTIIDASRFRGGQQDKDETADTADLTNRGGDIPPIDPPTREIRSADGEPEPRFVPSRSHQAREGIEIMSRGITTSLAGRPSLESAISEQIRADESLGTIYEELEIPRDYLAQHPNIRFTPPRIDTAYLESTLGIEAAARIVDYTYSSGLADAVVTSPERAAAWLTKVRSDLAGQVPSDALGSVLDDVMRSYTSNLELHRLTRDPEGTAVRFTHTPYQDLPGYDGPGVDRAPSAEAVHSRITSWFRNEPNPEILHGLGVGGARTRVTTTVRELEETHGLALDRTLDASLLAFRNPRR